MTYNRRLAITLFHLFNIAWIGMTALTIFGALFLLFVIIAPTPESTTSFAVPITLELDPGTYTVSSTIEPTSAEISDVTGMARLEYVNASPPKSLWLPSLLLGYAYVIGLIVILYQLRMLFKTLSARNPLDATSIYRLRVMGWILIVSNLLVVTGGYPLHLITRSVITDIEGIAWQWDYTFGSNLEDYNWLFAGLIILALAEVFRYSLAVQAERDTLQEEAELVV